MFESYMQVAISQLDQYQVIESDEEVKLLGNIHAAKECFLDRLSDVVKCAADQAETTQQKMKLQMLRGLLAKEVRELKDAA